MKALLIVLNTLSLSPQKRTLSRSAYLHTYIYYHKQFTQKYKCRITTTRVWSVFFVYLTLIIQYPNVALFILLYQWCMEYIRGTLVGGK